MSSGVSLGLLSLASKLTSSFLEPFLRAGITHIGSGSSRQGFTHGIEQQFRLGELWELSGPGDSLLDRKSVV